MAADAMTSPPINDAAVQLPLALRFPPDQRFETFTGAADGVLAQLHGLATGAGGLSAVYLSGPGGVGKTHLLLATCAEAEAAGRQVLYLPLAKMTGHLRDALEDCDRANLLAFDGIESIAGRHEDELALFHGHNRARDAGCAVLYASRHTPDEAGLCLPDLRSRLAQCVQIILKPLGDEARAQMLRLRAHRRGLQLDDVVIDWLLKRVDRDVPNLIHLLDELDRNALSSQSKLTIPFLRKILGR